MADVVAWLCYAGDRSLVAIEQGAREVSAAHPEYVGAKTETGGATQRWVDVPSRHGRADSRRWRCSGSCGGQNEKSMGHRVPRHHGEAKARLSRGRGAPWSSGHDETGSRVRLLAARKKSAHREFPVKTSDKSRLVGCASSKRSYDKLCSGWSALKRR